MGRRYQSSPRSGRHRSGAIEPRGSEEPRTLGRVLGAIFSRKGLLYFGVFLGTVVVVGGSLALYTFYGSDDLQVRYTIAINDARSGRIDITAEFSNHSKPLLLLGRRAGSKHMRVHNFRALTEDGEVLPNKWYGATRVVFSGFRSKVILKYQVKPGGLGRHGHQGALYHWGGIVPARILFYTPRRADNLESLLVRFKMPTGWRAVHAWKATKDGWFDPRLGGRLLRQSLSSSTIGFGRWHSVERNIGGNRFTVHTWAGWPPAFKRRVSERAARIFQVLQELFRFRFPTPFVVVFIPRAPDGKGIIAGYWSNGMGNEMEDSVRNWSLYAHRILHVLNRDHPYGTHLKIHPKYLPWKNPVNWFNEGVASFFEIWATIKAGIVASDSRFNRLWRSYIKKHVAGSKYLVAVAHEHLHRDPEIAEYLHYYKAPILVQNLDFWLRRRTGGKKSLAGFIASVYPTYAHHKKSLPFFDELVKYAGFDLTWFFDKYAVDDDILMPLWNDVFLKYGEGPRRVVATVNGEPVLADAAYRRYSRIPQAASAHRARLVREQLLLQELRSRGNKAIPQELLRTLPWLPARWRHMVVRKIREELCRSLFGAKGADSEHRLKRHLAQLRRRARVE